MYWSQLTLLVAIGALPWLPPTVTWAGEGQDVVRKVMEGWQNRRERIDVVRYELKGKRTWMPLLQSLNPKGTQGQVRRETQSATLDRLLHNIRQFVRRLQLRNKFTGTLNRTVLLDPKRDRFRVEGGETKYHGGRSAFSVRDIWAGNGKTVWYRSFENTMGTLVEGRANRHVDFVIYRRKSNLMPPMLFDSDYFDPLFYASGIVRSGETRIRPTRLMPDNEPSKFAFQRRAVEDKREFLVLRERITELWIDASKDFAIVKKVIKPDQPRYIKRIEYQETSAGWLPKRWSVEEFRNGKRVFSSEVEVESITLNPKSDDETFVLEPEPGMYVEEVLYRPHEKWGLQSDEKYYKINGDGSHTELNKKLNPIEDP